MSIIEVGTMAQNSVESLKKFWSVLACAYLLYKIIIFYFCEFTAIVFCIHFYKYLNYYCLFKFYNKKNKFV